MFKKTNTDNNNNNKNDSKKKNADYTCVSVSLILYPIHAWSRCLCHALHHFNACQCRYISTRGSFMVSDVFGCWILFFPWKLSAAFY